MPRNLVTYVIMRLGAAQRNWYQVSIQILGFNFKLKIFIFKSLVCVHNGAELVSNILFLSVVVVNKCLRDICGSPIRKKIGSYFFNFMGVLGDFGEL